MTARRGRHYLSGMRNDSQRKPPPLLDTPSQHASIQDSLNTLRFSSDHSPTRHASTRQFLSRDWPDRRAKSTNQFSTEDFNMLHTRPEFERHDFDIPRTSLRSERQIPSEEFEIPHTSLVRRVRQIPSEEFEIPHTSLVRGERQIASEEFVLPRRRQESDRFNFSHAELTTSCDRSRSTSTYYDYHALLGSNGTVTNSENLNHISREHETEKHFTHEDFNLLPTRPKRHLLPDDVDLRTMIEYKKQLANKDLNLHSNQTKFSLGEFVLPPRRLAPEKQFQLQEFDLPPTIHKSRRRFPSEDLDLPSRRLTPERQFRPEEFDLPHPMRSKPEFRSEEFDLPHPTRSNPEFRSEEFDLPPNRPKFKRQLPPETLKQSRRMFDSGRQYPLEDVIPSAILLTNQKRALLPTPEDELYQNKRQKIETSSSKGLLPLPKSGLHAFPRDLPPHPLHPSRASHNKLNKRAVETAPPMRGLLPLPEPEIQNVHSHRPLPPLMPPEYKKQAYPVRVKKDPVLSSLLPLPGPRMLPSFRHVESPTNFQKRPLLPTPTKPGILSNDKPFIHISPQIIDQSIIPPLLQPPHPPINKRVNNRNGRIIIGGGQRKFKESLMPTRISKSPRYRHEMDCLVPDYYPLHRNESDRKRPLLPTPDLF